MPEARISRASASFKFFRDKIPRPSTAIHPYIVSTVMVFAATVVSYLIESVVAPSSLSLVFMTAVLFSAVRYGLWPSIAASLLSESSWNFFFLPPKFSLAIEDPQDLLALILFLIVSLVVSNLTALQRRQSETMRAREKTTAQLYDFSQKIAAIGYLEELLLIIPRAIGTMLNCEVAILLPGGDGLRLETAYPMNLALNNIDLNAAHWSWSHNHPTGHGTKTLPEAGYCFLPLSTRRGSIGVIGIERASSPPFPDEERLLSILVDQTAVAIERAQLAETIDHARLQAETERLRSAMMTSVSHDLRTPLTTIIGAHSTLKSLGDACPPATRLELIDRAQSEAERLNRFIGNLLDMTKLESGKLDLKLGPIDIGEILESAFGRADQIVMRHKIAIDLPPDLPMAKGDFLLLEQVFFNLIDNAAKYTPSATEIRISASAQTDVVAIEIIDEGTGIPPDALDVIFDKFARVGLEDRRPPGTGLGLAICRGFLEAMGGTIMARNRKDRSGAIFTLRLAKAEISIESERAEFDG